MKILKYKTNIKCGGCEDKVAPYLNEIDGISRWDVDTTSPDNVLAIQAEDLLNDSIVVSAVKEAGFKIEPLYIEGVGGVQRK